MISKGYTYICVFVCLLVVVVVVVVFLFFFVFTSEKRYIRSVSKVLHPLVSDWKWSKSLLSSDLFRCCYDIGVVKKALFRSVFSCPSHTNDTDQISKISLLSSGFENLRFQCVTDCLLEDRTG